MIDSNHSEELEGVNRYVLDYVAGVLFPFEANAPFYTLLASIPFACLATTEYIQVAGSSWF